MRILIIRHGEAVGAGYGADADRYLTANGRAVTERVGHALADLGHAPSHLYTSPLVRAVQTAELLARAIEHPGPIPSHPPLAPGGATAHALAVLEDHADDDVVALVSHEPTVSTMSGHLLGIHVSGFPPSGVFVLEGDARGATLLGRLDPRTLAFG